MDIEQRDTRDPAFIAFLAYAYDRYQQRRDPAILSNEELVSYLVGLELSLRLAIVSFIDVPDEPPETVYQYAAVMAHYLSRAVFDRLRRSGASLDAIGCLIWIRRSVDDVGHEILRMFHATPVGRTIVEGRALIPPIDA